MTSSAGREFIQISDVLECSICLETFKDPKILPCAHTFCLQCLETFCHDKQPHEMSCPLCRKVFTVPSDGMQHLPNNTFIPQLLRLNNIAVTISTQAFDNLTVCELCSRSDVQRTSLSYCIECNQHICDRCTVMHTREDVTQSHRVIANDDMTNSAEISKSSVNYNCDEHPSEENRLYCYDCKKIMCSRCFSKHYQHRLSDVREYVAEFREQMKKYTEKVLTRASKKQEEIEHLVTDEKHFMKRAESTEWEILQKYDELIAHLQSQKMQLMKQLQEFKERVIEQNKKKRNEIEMQMQIMERLTTCCLKMMKDGTSSDIICRTAQDIRTTAEELGITQDVPDADEARVFKLTFKPNASTTDSVKNFIGELILDETAERIEKLNASSFLDDFEILGVIPADAYVTGLTVLESELFIVHNGSTQVNVYDTNILTPTHIISITGSFSLRAIVASPRYNCLYISDDGQNVIYRYNLTDKVISSWPVGGRCYGLSLTSMQNLVVTPWNTNVMKEYTPDGSLVREISLDSSIEDPWQSFQLSSDQFIVSHGHKGPIHRVCKVDKHGFIIQSYGGSKGATAGKLNRPTNLAVDSYGNVVVADSFNNTVVLLSSSLTHLGYVKIPGHALRDPWALHLDLPTRRLYIGENTTTGRVFVLAACTHSD